jgi:hypothetical protein
MEHFSYTFKYLNGVMLKQRNIFLTFTLQSELRYMENVVWTSPLSDQLGNVNVNDNYHDHVDKVEITSLSCVHQRAYCSSPR